MAFALSTIYSTPLHRYCRWSLAATVACMPLYVVRYHVGPLPTTLLETLALITIALYAASRLTPPHSWGGGGEAAGGAGLRRTPLEIPTAFFVLAAIVGIFVSVEHLGALGQFRAYFLEPIVLFYIALEVLETPRDFRLILGAFLAGATLFAILNLGVWADVLARHQPIISTNAPEALDQNPNAAAMFLEPAVALAAGLALYSDSKKDRLASLACLVFLLASMVLTLSRAGLLTLAVLSLVAVITMPQPRAKLLLLGGAALGAFLVSRVPWVAIRLAHQFDPHYGESTLHDRLRIWNETLHMLHDHPIFGAGLRSYTEVVAPYVGKGYVAQLHPHDIWLAMWSELGMLGVVAFASLLGILLWGGWRGFASAHGFYRALLWGTSAGFVAIVVHGIFDTPYFKNDLSLEFWILAALEMAALGMVARHKMTRQPELQR